MADSSDPFAFRKPSLTELWHPPKFDPATLEDRIAELRSQLPLKLIDAFDGLMSEWAAWAMREGFQFGNQVSGALLARSKVLAGICEQCGTMYVKKSSDKRFCSDTCRVQANRDKNFS